MDLTHHNRMFTDLATHQNLISERSFAIASHFHQPLSKWLQDQNLSDLTFLYRPILLLFKREFSIPNVYSIWDMFFSSAKPFSSPRFFMASILIQLFPKLLLVSDGSMGGAMSVTDSTISTLDTDTLIRMSKSLYEKCDSSLIWAQETLPPPPGLKDYEPKFFKKA